jgi:hypothetical protein
MPTISLASALRRAKDNCPVLLPYVGFIFVEGSGPPDETKPLECAFYIDSDSDNPASATRCALDLA